MPMPVMLRPQSQETIRAWRGLYGYAYSDADSVHVATLAAARGRVMQEQGVNFPVWVLDKVGIDIMFANRVAMGPGLAPPRFRWVAFVDPLMYPLDTRGEARTPDMKALFPLTAKLLRRYERESGVASAPPTLDAYLRTVVTPTLERIRRGGAVAVKFEAGYLRPLDFGAASASEAGATYGRYAAGGVPDRASYKNLQDYLFHYIAREAGRLGMAVHIHMIAGFGPYYLLQGSEPYQLEPTFNDAELRGTTFVIIHGGSPLTNKQWRPASRQAKRVRRYLGHGPVDSAVAVSRSIAYLDVDVPGEGDVRIRRVRREPQCRRLGRGRLGRDHQCS